VAAAQQAQAALLIGLFELGGELASAVDLQGANGKGHAVEQGFQKLGDSRELRPTPRTIIGRLRGQRS
jgi:hypothetical protein